MDIYGIDVCCYQGDINWSKVKVAGCEFAVLKCIKKDFAFDSKFKANVKGCIENGIAVSVYTYVYENDKSGAEKRARAVLKALEEFSALNGCMVWWDVEDASIRKTGVSSRAKLTESIKAARAIITGAGYGFGVYCDADFYTSCLNANVIGGKWWIAKYGKNSVTRFGKKPTDKKPVIANELCGWQYCSRGQVPGIRGSVDLDVAYDDDFTKRNGDMLHLVADLPTIRYGDCGQPVQALQRLLGIKVSGTFDSYTKSAVESYQKVHKLDVDGVVGQNTWKKILS